MATSTSNKRRIEELNSQIAKRARFESVPQATIMQEIQAAVDLGDLEDCAVIKIVEERLQLQQLLKEQQERELQQQLLKEKQEREQELQQQLLKEKQERELQQQLLKEKQERVQELQQQLLKEKQERELQQQLLKEKQEREQELQQQLLKEKQEREQEAKLRKEHTIAGALALTEAHSDLCKLVNRGTKSSHTSPKDEPAEVETMKFPFKAIPNSDLFMDKTSALMATFSRGDWKYHNEHDVQTFVHAVLQDAVVVCNTILNKTADANPVPIELSVRREARLDSNLLDHSVVFDLYSALPVFEIETKKPVDEPLDDQKLGKVAGQLFNQLSAMKAFGHPNPFAALTTFDETRIVWLSNTGTTERVLADFNSEGMTDDWINKVISKLSIAKKQPLTQSPVGIEPESSPCFGPRVSKNAQFTKARPQIQMSEEAFRVHEMLPALVNAILCSLDGFHKAKQPLVRLNQNLLLKRTALKLEEACYKWGELEVQCKGKAVSKKNLFVKREKPVLFVIDFLGSGTTSRAYRAVSKDGKECVLKIYVRKYDETSKKLLEQKKFDEQAKVAVLREVQMYHTIYPNIKKHVFYCELNKLHCVVHPFFEHIEQRTEDEVDRVKTHLQEKFAPHRIGFKDGDIGWRHIGKFQEQLYLFDLADLEKIDNCKAYIEKHADCLLKSLPIAQAVSQDGS